MRLLCVHAHFDDFEFVAAGSFESMRRRAIPDYAAKLIVCTDGKAGHHFRSREETGRIRLEEQRASAAIGGYEMEPLTLPDGTTLREGCLQTTPEILAALWRSIRAFEPDYLFCPPLPLDNLAGIHADHVIVAEAVRKLAYLLNVPHTYTPEYPADETQSVWIKTPVILNAYDPYMAGHNAFDIAINIEECFDAVARMTWSHQSQINEWLPWVARHHMSPVSDIDEWKKLLRARFVRQNRELGVDSKDAYEFFTVTAWGETPTVSQILSSLPVIDPSRSRLEELELRLNRWRGL